MSDYITKEAAKEKHCQLCQEVGVICFTTPKCCDDIAAIDAMPAAESMRQADR